MATAGKKSIRDLDVAGKRVLVRADLNVAQDESGRITDDSRVRAALSTLQYLMDHGARVVLCSHLGRPKGQVVEKYRLDPVAHRLAELLGGSVRKIDTVTGCEAQEAAASLQNGEILLLENVRFEPGEEKNDPELARRFAALADIYVNDAFGAAHRAHASTEGVAHFLPAVAGLLMEKELEALGHLLTAPKRPFLAILGGAKVSDKIGVIQNLLDRVDRLLIGGGMANTFFRAQGLEVGASLLEVDKVPLARKLLEQAEGRILLPTDCVVAPSLKEPDKARTVTLDQVGPADMILDVGPATAQRFASVIAEAGTVFWNGPMGVFEVPAFAQGTLAVARAVADSPAMTVVGGGDSLAAINQSGLGPRIDHLSTGGGASLEFMEGKTLPGVACLLDGEEALR